MSESTIDPGHEDNQAYDDGDEDIESLIGDPVDDPEMIF